MKTNRLYDVYVTEGGFYSPGSGEDGPCEVYDLGVGITLRNVDGTPGARYTHGTFVARGWYVSEDGWCAPNRGARVEAVAFAAKVLARGVVDLAYWDLAPEPMSLAESWALEAEREQNERADGGW
jgi:hypothetical protein